MNDFEERWGHLTVGEALELNRKAKETCEFEITASVECDEDIDYVV